MLIPLSIWSNSKKIMITIIMCSVSINCLALVFPLTLLQIYDRIIPQKSGYTLLLLCTLVLGALIFETILKTIRSYVSAWGDAKFEHEFNNIVFARIVKSDLYEFEKHGAGTHLERINAINHLKDIYLGQTIITLVELPFLFLYLLLILYIGGFLLLVPVLTIAIMIFVSGKQGDQIEQSLENRRTQDDRRMNFIIESLHKIHTIKTCGMEEQIMRRYERLQSGNTINNYSISMNNNNISTTAMLMGQLTMIVLVSCGSIIVINQNLTVGGLVACTILSGRCFNPINQSVALWTRMKNIKTSQTKLLEVLDLKQESEDQLSDIGRIEGLIEINNVSVETLSGKQALPKVTLKINKGECVSISGEGSHGKSTLLWSLIGIVKPTTGTICIDHKNIHDYDLQSLRNQVAYLPQTFEMFNGSILENLTLFEPSKASTVRTLAKNLGLSTFIETLPEGYDTQVGHQTTESLPQGTRQLIAIIRALRTQPRIILFDEANTAMDFKTDEVLKKIISKIKGQYTMIIVSYRPSFLSIADKHYLLTKEGLIQA